MSQINLTKNKFNSNGYWCEAIPGIVYFPDVYLFDQNGYDLTVLYLCIEIIVML